MACRATGGLVSDERIAWLLEACDGSPALAESLLVEGVWERGGRVRAPAGGTPVPVAIGEPSAALKNQARCGWPSTETPRSPG